MTTMRGPGSYGIPAQNPFGASNPDQSESINPLDAIRKQTSKIEDLLDTFSQPIRPYVPSYP